MNMIHNAEMRALKMLRLNRYMVLATTSGSAPWIAPLAYVSDSSLRLIFYSAIASRHSLEAAANPRVAVTIFNSQSTSDDADGIQASGRVSEVDSAELPSVMNYYFTKSFPDTAVRAKWTRPVSDFTGQAEQRFYFVVPDELFVLDMTSTKIDKRVAVKMSVMQQLLSSEG